MDGRQEIGAGVLVLVVLRAGLGAEHASVGRHSAVQGPATQ